MSDALYIIVHGISESFVRLTHLGWDKMAAILQTIFFKLIYLNEMCCILLKNSMNTVPKAADNNMSALVQIMAWDQAGNKPLSEPIMM